MKMKTIKLGQTELDNAFPIELLAMLTPSDLAMVELLKLKALTQGVSEDNITQVTEIIESYNK